MAGRAVVVLQPHHLGAGKILLEAQDVVDLGAAPAIDRLVVVADAAQVLRLRGIGALDQQPQPQILGGVGVLVFVHQNIFEALLVLAQHIRLFTQQAKGFEQEIAEIDGVKRLQPLLVERVELRPLPLAKACASPAGTCFASRPRFFQLSMR